MSDIDDSSAIMLAIICFVLYFVPTFNASSRKHPNVSSIFLLNLLLGWTLIGWVAAIVWSASSVKKTDQIISSAVEPDNKYTQIEKLGALKEKGLITDSEFELEKSKLLSS